MNQRTRNALVISAIALFFVFGVSVHRLAAATIYTTGSSDTLNTFRTNVNSSLTNLNTDRIGTSTTPTSGQLTYWTGAATLASIAGATTNGTTLTLTAPLGIGTSSPYAALSVVGASGVVADKFHATNTAATTTLQKTVISGAVELLGEYFTSFTTYVRSLFTCGRSLTCNSGNLDADPELYTFGVTANLVATSTNSGIATGTPAMVWKQVPVASTITGFECGVAPGVKTGTSTVRAVLATDAIGTGATDLLYTTGVSCGSALNTATSTFGQTAVAAGDWIGFYVSDAEPTGSRPGRINAAFTLTKND